MFSLTRWFSAPSRGQLQKQLVFGPQLRLEKFEQFLKSIDKKDRPVKIEEFKICYFCLVIPYGFLQIVA